MQKWIYYWLLGVGISHIILGVVFIFIADSSLINSYIDYLYEVFSLEQEKHSPVNIILKSILQLFGPTIASWGVLFTLCIMQYKQNGNPFARMMIILSLLVWFIFDSVLSTLNGITLHVYINTLTIVSLLVPFLLLKPREDIT